MKKFILSAAFLVVLAGLTPPAQAITLCHDYTVYQVSGQQVDYNRMKVASLRLILEAKDYQPIQYTRSTRLIPGDVVMLGDAHSGIVGPSGRIDHYIQRVVPGKLSGSRFLPEHLPPPARLSAGGLFRGDTLAQMQGRLSIPHRGTIKVWRVGLAGRWRRADGHEVDFTKSGSTSYVGTVAKLTPLLKACKFSNGEQTFTLARNTQGAFEGRIKWRWTSGKQEWRAVNITLKDKDHMRDDNGGSWDRVKSAGR